MATTELEILVQQAQKKADPAAEKLGEEFVKNCGRLTLSHKIKIDFLTRLGTAAKGGLGANDFVRLEDERTRRAGQVKGRFAYHLDGRPQGNAFVSALARLMLEANLDFPDAIDYFPNVFPTAARAGFRAGWNSGKFPEAVQHQAEQLKKAEKLRNKFILTLIQPTILFGVAIVVVLIFITRVFPPLRDALLDTGNGKPIDMGLPAESLLWLSDVLTKYGVVLIPGLVLLGIGYFSLRRTSQRVRLGEAWLWLHLPWIGPAMVKMDISNFAFALATLLDAGGVESRTKYFGLAIASFQNLYLREQALKALRAFEKGVPGSMAEALALALPGACGEHTSVFRVLRQFELIGGVEDVAGYSVTMAEAAEFDLNQFSEVLPNLCLAVCAGIVLWLVFALILPLFQIIQNLSK